jgi:hypothetical protein
MFSPQRASLHFTSHFRDSSETGSRLNPASPSLAMTHGSLLRPPWSRRQLHQSATLNTNNNLLYTWQLISHTTTGNSKNSTTKLSWSGIITSPTMAEQTQPVSPINNKRESMTTREEMDFEDNEHEQETGRVSPLGHETTTSSKPVKTSPSPKPRVSFQDVNDEIPPTKPPRPQSPQQQAEHTLIEAFPSIDAKVVRAVLMASGGKVEPAFNALLGMTDPDFQPEEVAPPQPPRPAQRQQQQRQPQSQLEADEMYARQLAEQYNNQGPDLGRGQQTRYNQR